MTSASHDPCVLIKSFVAFSLLCCAAACFQYAVVCHVHAKDTSQEIDEYGTHPPKEQDHLVGRVDLSFLLPSGPREI